MKRILSSDGGGYRGVIPASILTLIERAIGPAADNFDLIAGTSTGGILAAGLELVGAGGTRSTVDKSLLV